jgi:hypothetical protein
LSCIACFESKLKACPSSIKLIAGLAPSTDYYWLLRSPKGRIYQKLATSETDGSLIIDVSMIEAGTLNKYAGFFNLELRLGTNYLQTVPMTLQGDPHDCVQIEFVDLVQEQGDDTEMNVIK